MIKAVTDRNEWHALLAEFPADAYYLPEYLEAFRVHGDGEPLLLLFDSGNVRAVNAVMRRPVPLEGFEDYCDFTTVYGYGGWIFNGHPSPSDLSALDAELIEYCRSIRCVSEFVRFHPVLGNAEGMGRIYEIADAGSTVFMDLRGGADGIMANISSKNRNVIRKAQKSGVIISSSSEKSAYDEFIPIYNATMDRDSARAYYYFGTEFYEALRLGLKDGATVYRAELDGKTIASAIILSYGKNVHYHLSGSLSEYRQYAANNLLLYTVACDFGARGYEKFHLGGGVGGDVHGGLYHFKESFNKNGVLPFCVGKKIYDEELYRVLSERNGQTAESSFFPKYRA